MLLKLLQPSIKHGEKAQQVKGTVRRWFQKFVGDESLKDGNGRRRPLIQNEDLRALVEQNPRQSEREMSTQLGVKARPKVMLLREVQMNASRLAPTNKTVQY